MFCIALHNDVYFQHLPNVYDYVFNINIKIIINLKCWSLKTKGFFSSLCRSSFTFFVMHPKEISNYCTLYHTNDLQICLFEKRPFIYSLQVTSLFFEDLKELYLKCIIVCLKVICWGVIKSLKITSTFLWLHRTGTLNSFVHNFPKICIIFLQAIQKLSVGNMSPL